MMDVWRRCGRAEGVVRAEVVLLLSFIVFTQDMSPAETTGKKHMRKEQSGGGMSRQRRMAQRISRIVVRLEKLDEMDR